MSLQVNLRGSGMSIPLISFFTGGGFLDMGFEQAGFDIVWTNEINAAFAGMYEYAITNWRKTRGVDKPATVSEHNSIAGLWAEGIMARAFGFDKPEIFGIIGGPPCPDFSVAGKNRGANGKTGVLLKTFIDLICQIRPAFFVMENVPGLYRTRCHRLYFQQLIEQLEAGYGYVTDAKVVGALQLGIPQDRDRLFLVGFQRDFAISRLGRPIMPGEQGWFCWPQPEYPQAKHLPWPQINPFGASVACPPEIPLQLTVYPLLADNPEGLPNGQEYFSPRSEKFWERDEGDVSGKSFKRLHRYRYSPTVGYGNNEVHLHPWKPRRLSVREALRIQSLPDTYVLPPGYSLTSKFKLISNGVPFRVAEQIASSVIEFIGGDG